MSSYSIRSRLAKLAKMPMCKPRIFVVKPGQDLTAEQLADMRPDDVVIRMRHAEPGEPWGPSWDPEDEPDDPDVPTPETPQERPWEF